LLLPVAGKGRGRQSLRRTNQTADGKRERLMTVFSTWQYRNGAASLGKIERLRRVA